MNVEIKGSAAFEHVHATLAPGEAIVAEAGAMASMASDIAMETRLSGGLWGALLKRLGGESMFVNVFRNRGPAPQTVVLAPPTPGGVRGVALDGGSLYIEPGAFLAATPGIQLAVRVAGFRSLILREGFFRLQASGQGTVWLSSYGAMVEKDVQGEYLIDTGHIVAFEPSLSLRLQLAGGLWSSLFGGEGFVARLRGRGRVIMQTRSIEGLAAWANPYLPS